MAILGIDMLDFREVSDYLLARNQYEGLVSKMVETDNTNGYETAISFQPFAFKRRFAFPNTKISIWKFQDRKGWLKD